MAVGARKGENMGWLNDLELVRLLRMVLVSMDDRWDIADVGLDAFIIPILLCGFSSFSYCMDIYQLVKRTTMTETMIGMLLPGMTAFSGAVWLTDYGSLPGKPLLAELVEQPFSLALSVQMTVCALLFAVIFALTRLCWRGGWKGRRKAGERRWIATYTLDILTAFTAFATGCYGIFTNLVLHRGSNLFAGCSALYGIFLYLLPLLLFKMVLLLLLLLLRVYSAKITVFPYRQGMHAGRYLYRWLLLYHCPLLREVLVFILAIGLLLGKASGETVREDALMSAAFFGFLALGYLWAAVRRSTLPLKKFCRWEKAGIDRKEQFCREYFCEEPLFRDEEYTLTKSFLVDERDFSGIFYLGDLRYLPRGWEHDGGRWTRVIIFGDGSRIVLEKGKQNCEAVFRGIDRYAKSYGITESRAMADGITNPQKAYNNTIKGQVQAVWTMAMLLILTVVLMDGLGVW